MLSLIETCIAILIDTFIKIKFLIYNLLTVLFVRYTVSKILKKNILNKKHSIEFLLKGKSFKNSCRVTLLKDLFIFNKDNKQGLLKISNSVIKMFLKS